MISELHHHKLRVNNSMLPTTTGIKNTGSETTKLHMIPYLSAMYQKAQMVDTNDISKKAQITYYVELIP